MNTDAERQRQYYANTAHAYDDMHVHPQDAHALSLHLLSALIDFHGIRSVLDVGAGTGRTLLWLRQRHPGIILRGIEPVAAMREEAYRKGLPSDELTDGNGYTLPFTDNSFEMVCEFGVLHHVAEPRRVVREMTRVATRIVAISDSNFMAQGHPWMRRLKHGLFHLGLWPLVDRIKTRGKGYTISQDDGLAYSYTIFQDLGVLREAWKTVRMTAVRGHQGGPAHPKLTADQFFLVGIDKRRLDSGL